MDVYFLRSPLAAVYSSFPNRDFLIGTLCCKYLDVPNETNKISKFHFVLKLIWNFHEAEFYFSDARFSPFFQCFWLEQQLRNENLREFFSLCFSKPLLNFSISVSLTVWHYHLVGHRRDCGFLSGHFCVSWPSVAVRLVALTRRTNWSRVKPS